MSLVTVQVNIPQSLIVRAVVALEQILAELQYIGVQIGKVGR